MKGGSSETIVVLFLCIFCFILSSIAGGVGYYFMDLKFLVFLNIYHLSLILSQPQQSNRMVYLFFRVFEVLFLLP